MSSTTQPQRSAQLDQTIYTVIEIVMYMIHTSIIVVTFFRRKTIYQNPFYYIMSAICFVDLLYFVIITMLVIRGAYYGPLTHIYEEHTWIASAGFCLSNVFGYGQFFGQSLIAVNRFTIFWFPVKHKKISTFIYGGAASVTAIFSGLALLKYYLLKRNHQITHIANLEVRMLEPFCKTKSVHSSNVGNRRQVYYGREPSALQVKSPTKIEPIEFCAAMSDAIITAFRHDDISARLIQLNDSARLHDSYLRLFRVFRKQDTASKFGQRHELVFIGYLQNTATYKTRQFGYYRGRSETTVPESEFQTAFIQHLYSTLSEDDILAISKSWELKEAVYLVRSKVTYPLSFSDLWLRQVNLKQFVLVLNGITFETGDILEKVLSSNANLKSCNYLNFGFLPFDMCLQPFFNYFDSLPCWPREFGFAFKSESISIAMIKEKNASIYEMVKQRRPRGGGGNVLEIAIQPDDMEAICHFYVDNSNKYAKTGVSIFERGKAYFLLEVL
uniref:Serpentine receptor class gamma n=1 Tax=Panagrellus redivivus TaxID=6233 RepID=A0A7E4W511_PANRE